MGRTGGRGWRGLTAVLAATVTLAGVGLAAVPAAADTNISVALAIDTPLAGAAATTLYVGQLAHYQLTVTAGPSDLTGVSFTDTLPADLTYNSVTGTGWSCAFAAPTITCNQANTVAATTTSTAALDLTMSATSTLPSVTFNPTGTATTPAGATGALATPAIVPVLTAADLSLAKALNPPPSSGQVSYNLAVTNHGPSTASHPITIADTLPAGLTLASGTGPGWTCSASGPAITCTGTTDLASGATSTVNVVANVPAGNPGAITTTASVSSATFDPNQTNNTAAAPQSTSLTLAAKVSTPEIGAAPNTVYDGQPAAYQLTVTNTTAGPLAGITIADRLPPDLTYTSAAGTGWTCTGAPNLTCTGADLAAGASSTLTLNVTVAAAPAANPIANSPTATSTSPAFSTIAASATPVLPAADVALVKAMAAPPGPGRVSYTLAVTNNGPSTAGQPITITDTLPLGLTLASATGAGWTCTIGGQALTCIDTTDLAPGASTVTVVANVPAGNPGLITTAASVTSATFDPNQANNLAYAPQGVVPYGNPADPGPCGLPSAATPPVRTCNLIASAGTITVPGFAAAVPIWGFAIDPGNGTTPAGTVPGPTLVANEGETLNLSLRNALPVHGPDHNLLAINIPGMTTSHPDDTGIPSGTSTASGSPSYTWANLRPGTYLYEAGPTTNGARQVAMGLSGLLVVRPKGFSPANMILFDPAPAAAAAAPTACASPSGSSQFTAEQLVEVNELSSDFHNNPFGSTLTPGGGNGPINTQATNSPGGSADVGTYMPDVFLINGQAYPSTAVTQVSGTDCVALHYANLGMLEKSYGVLGRRQTVMADDSFALAAPQNLATKYLNPGEEVDTVVDMTGATLGTQFPIMDFGRHLHNGSGSANSAAASANTGMTLGGQLAMLQVSGAQPATLNPAVDLLGLDHNTVAADAANKLTPAQLNLTARGIARAAGTIIAGGEFTVDAITPPGTAPAGQTLTAGGAAVIPASTFLALGNGDHVIWVRVKDSGGNWSDPPTGVVFTFDRVSGATNPQGGPIITNFSLDPTLTNGNTPNKTPGAIDSTSGVPATSSDMVIDGTATPPLPDWAITSFSWSIDGGPSTAVPVNGNPGSSVEINTAIPQATLQALAGDTTHNVSVTATETQGTSTRTGNPVTLQFIKAVTGPSATIDSITPNPAGPASDHSANLNYFPSVRIRGTLNDNVAPIAGGEMWWLPVVNGAPVGLTAGKPMPDGQGIQVTPDGGTWTDPAGQPVKFSVDIPSNEFNALPQGTVRVYVHGRDQAGSWNQTWASRDLTLDKTQPVIMDHTTGKPDPIVTSPSPGHFTLDFWAQDPGGSPVACTVTGTQITPPGCGIPETSKVTAVEWQIAYDGVVDVTELNDFTIHLPAPTDGPVEIPIDLSGGPQPYPAGTTVVYRIRDGAGNWTDWYTTSVS